METTSMDAIHSKIRTKEERVNFFREQGNFLLIILGLYFPNESGYDSKYFLQVLSGQKNVKFLLI